ncbi:MAG: hypothetical protein ACPGVT_01400 [Maricaulaceae bacterium]
MLFTPRLFVLDENGQTENLHKPRFSGQGICIIPRGECSFRRIRMAGEGRNALRAVELKARNDALSGETDFFVHSDKQSPDDINAMSGVWGFARSHFYNGRCLPETLAQTPLADGQRLVKNLTGYEGQFWVKGNLISSRWWPSLPSDVNWKAFVRAIKNRSQVSGLSLEMPNAISVPWRDDIPLFAMDAKRAEVIFSPLNVAILATFVFAYGFSYTGAKYAREYISYQSVQTKQEAISGEAEQILSQRRRALGAMRYVKSYEALGHNGTVLAGYDALAKVLGSTGLGVERTTYRNGKLELRLQGDNEISISDVVSLLEAQPVMENVTVSLEALGAVAITTDLVAPLNIEAAEEL